MLKDSPEQLLLFQSIRDTSKENETLLFLYYKSCISKPQFVEVILMKGWKFYEEQKEQVRYLGYFICLKYQIKKFINEWLTKSVETKHTIIEWMELEKKLSDTIEALCNQSQSVISLEIKEFNQLLLTQELSFEILKAAYTKYFLNQSYSIYIQSSFLWKIIAFLYYQQDQLNNIDPSSQSMGHTISKIQDQTTRIETEFECRRQQQQKIIQQENAAKQKDIIAQVKKQQSLICKKDYQKGKLIFNSSFSVAKFKTIPTIKALMILQTNFDVIILVMDTTAYESQILLFLIPFGYLLAETLAYYQEKGAKNLTIYDLFNKIIQKINKIKNSTNPQLQEKQIMNHIVVLLKYMQMSPIEISNKLGEFLKAHRQQMSTFIPVYHDIFSFHAFQKYHFIEEIQSEPSIEIRHQKLQQKIKQLYSSFQKYNNNDI